MNCRRVNGLLSAFLDAELTGAEMLAIRAHLDECDVCRMEHQTLRDTKYMVASLKYKAPRADLEALLIDRQARPQSPPSGGMSIGVRPLPIAATVLFSLAGLWLATKAVNLPGDGLWDAADHVTPLYTLPPMAATQDTPVALTSVVTAPNWGTPLVNASAGPVFFTQERFFGSNSAARSEGFTTSVSVTTMSDGRGDTVRIYSTKTSGAPFTLPTAESVAPAYAMPMLDAFGRPVLAPAGTMTTSSGTQLRIGFH